MKKNFYILIIFYLFVSCEKENRTDEPLPAFRTVIVYIAGDNDLSDDALNDIEEMKRGYSEAGVNLIVFADLQGQAPEILKIGKNSAEIVLRYPEFNSAEAAQVQRTLNDIVTMYPAASYGLVLWSHATSWLPAGVRLRSFGQDSDKQMNIAELAAALPVHFDFILFDACLMGAVEVAC
ncbi:MAG: clostripain, partial [Prevotellaceae bacterium]|nr:clostripain [Prevotellaceae bacterium]